MISRFDIDIAVTRPSTTTREELEKDLREKITDLRLQHPCAVIEIHGVTWAADYSEETQ